jgi:hypothetical protein
MNWRARPRHSERSSHGPRSGMQKRNPWGGRARLFPKSIQLQCLKYPPVAHPRGDHSDRRSTCHVTSRLLVPFPENTVAHPDTAVFIHAGVPIGKAPRGTPVFLTPLGSGTARGPQGGRPRCSGGAFRPIPGHPLSGRPNCCRLPCPACLPGLAPITRRTSSAEFSRESVRKGKNSRVLRIGWSTSSLWTRRKDSNIAPLDPRLNLRAWCSAKFRRTPTGNSPTDP